jgi:hypothetical protein
VYILPPGWRNISRRKAALAASIYQLSEKFSSSFTPTNLARQLSKYAHKRDELHYCGFTFQPRLVTEESVTKICMAQRPRLTESSPFSVPF